MRADRHRAHDSKRKGAASLGLAVLLSGACGGVSLPRPDHVQIKAEDYVAVPFEPRTPPVEILPPRPEHEGHVVWADGGWEWSNDRYRWQAGAWVAPPAGAKRARWVIVRRPEDGQLFFAPSSWRDASGRLIDPPEPLARARREGVRTAGDAGTGATRPDLDD